MSTSAIVCFQLVGFIIQIVYFHRAMAHSYQCDLSNSVNLQSAAFTHSIIVRVQRIQFFQSQRKQTDPLLHQVLIREIIKDSSQFYSPIQLTLKINDIIVIRIQHKYQHAPVQEDTCWRLLEFSNIDIILFLNQTQTDQFDLNYPPVEATIRVRQNIDDVLNYETYPPQVLIKARPDRALISKEYSLQCNSRGNPLPRLFWSKQIDSNRTFEYFPASKQCLRPCPIYSIQNKYQSILYFRSFHLDDIGIYVCHAENPMNRTSTTFYLDYDSASKNTSCASLKYCHHHGQCIFIDHRFKCLCDNRYFGELCETNYDEIVKKQDNAILLFKSRFLAGCILILVGSLLVLIACLSWFLSRQHRKRTSQVKRSTTPSTSDKNKLIVKPSVPTVKDNVKLTDANSELPRTSPIESTPKEVLSTSPTGIRVSQSSISEKQSPIAQTIPNRSYHGTFTRESSTATEDDDDLTTLNGLIRHYHSLPGEHAKIDEEYEERFSLQMNKSEELGLSYLNNGISSNGVLSVIENPIGQHGTGIIRPLGSSTDSSQRFTKYVSSYSKFVLPRPIQAPTHEYLQR